MTWRRSDRILLRTGVVLILVAFAGMSVRRSLFAFSDMRVFDWIAANAVLTVAGVVLILVALVRRMIRR